MYRAWAPNQIHGFRPVCPEPGPLFLPLNLRGESLGIWGSFQLYDLNKLSIEGKIPELAVQKKPLSFLLHSVAKGWARGKLLANTETKGHQLLIHSSDTECPVHAGHCAAPSVKEHTQALAQEGVEQFLVCTKFLPFSVPLLRCPRHPHAALQSQLKCYFLSKSFHDHPTCGGAHHLSHHTPLSSQNLWLFIVI